MKAPEHCRNLDQNKGNIQNKKFDHDWLRRETLFHHKQLNMSNKLEVV